MDRRPQYIWIFVILANIGAYLAIVRYEIGYGYYGIKPWISSVTEGRIADIGLSLFISILPVLLSGLNFKWCAYLGYGMPLTIIIFSVYHFFNCSGKFCNVGDVPLIIVSVIFAVFFTLGLYLRKWNTKIVVVLLWIEIILLIGFTMSNVYSSHLNAVSIIKLNSLQKEVQNGTDPVEIARICDSAPGGSSSRNPFKRECWRRVIALYPNVDVCAWSKEENSKETCLLYEGYLNEHICEGKDHQVSYLKKDDQAENERLAQCWRERVKIYPELNICQWTYEWNQQKCANSLKTISPQ